MKQNRIYALIVGIVAAFALLEGSLQIMGVFMQQSLQKEKKHFAVQDSTTTIVCLGDSFTYGFGAPRGKGYPEQLQKMMNTKPIREKVVVINKGIYAQNSASVLEEMPAIFETINPDVVLLLIGANNKWNFKGFYEYSMGNTLWAHMLDAMYNLKTMKLFRLLFLNIRNMIGFRKNIRHYSKPFDAKYQEIDAGIPKDEEIMAYKRQITENPNNDISLTMLAFAYKRLGDYEKAKEYFTEAQKINPKNALALLGLGQCEFDVQEYEKAGQYFLQGIAIDPKNIQNYEGMAWTSFNQRKYDEAIDWFQKARLLDPGRAGLYYGIGWSYQLLNENEKAIEWYLEGVKTDISHTGCILGVIHMFKKTNQWDKLAVFIDELSVVDPAFTRNYKALLKQSDMQKKWKEWLRHDVNAMIDMCTKNNIRIFLHSYPNGDIASEVLRKIAEEKDIPIIDHSKHFASIVRTGKDQSEYFIPDGHCTQKGYGVMARLTFRKLLEVETVSYSK